MLKNVSSGSLENDNHYRAPKRWRLLGRTFQLFSEIVLVKGERVFYTHYYRYKIPFNLLEDSKNSSEFYIFPIMYIYFNIKIMFWISHHPAKLVDEEVHHVDAIAWRGDSMLPTVVYYFEEHNVQMQTS